MESSEVKPFISLPDPGAYMRSPTGNRIAVRATGTQTGGGFALLEAEDAVVNPFGTSPGAAKGCPNSGPIARYQSHSL
jgi:hypothetical protein